MTKYNKENYCACGCGQETTFINSKQGFRKYRRGHSSRIPEKNNFLTKIAKEKSLQTRRELIKKGTYKPFVCKKTKKHWCSGLTKETDERVAKMAKSISENSCEVKSRSTRLKEGRASGQVPTLFGLNHSQWKGGISSLQNVCRNNTELYKKWIRPKLEKSNFKCQHCGISGNLEVHHDQETFSYILRIIAQNNNWSNVCLNISKYSTEDIYRIKKKISKEVADYHVVNKISGISLCSECHKNFHKS